MNKQKSGKWGLDIDATLGVIIQFVCGSRVLTSSQLPGKGCAVETCWFNWKNRHGERGGGAGKQFNYEPAARGILGHGSIPLGVTACLWPSGMKISFVAPHTSDEVSSQHVCDPAEGNGLTQTAQLLLLAPIQRFLMITEPAWEGRLSTLRTRRNLFCIWKFIWGVRDIFQNNSLNF